jgi:hypothetical protein
MLATWTDYSSITTTRSRTVPIGAVAKVESDTVTVSLTTDEIGALPSHKVHRLPLIGGKRE